MDIFLFGHPVLEGGTTVLTEPMKNWLGNQDIERCIVFTTGGAYPELLHEIEEANKTAAFHIETHPLQLISTRTATKPTDVQKQPWEVFRELIKQIDDTHESVLLCGRSNALYDHLLWLVAQCLPNTTLLNMDTAKPPLNLFHENIGGEVAPRSIAAILSCHLEDILDGRADIENIGVTDAARLGNMVDAGQVSGIHAALSPFVTRKMIQRTEVSENSVTYEILPNGLGEACQQWMKRRPEVEEHTKTLNLVFGRLPYLSSPNEKGHFSSFDPFFDFMSPLQPVDGLLAVVQRHDEEIQGNHVLTLDEAIERFESTNLIGDLKHCKTVLGRRAKEDRFQTSDHLIIINPVATPTFHMEVVMAMLTACLKFERQNGARSWAVDITGSMAPLRSAVSFFAFVFKTTTTYIVKDKGEGDEVSKLRRRDLAIAVPNSMAFSAMSRLSKGHGNNKGASNLLIALLLAEAKKVDTTDYSDVNPFDTSISLVPTQHGLLASEIQFFIQEEFVTELGLSAGVIEQFGRTIRENLLVEQGLITAKRPPGKAATHTRYSLTFLGAFVAEQLLRIRESEVGN